MQGAIKISGGTSTVTGSAALAKSLIVRTTPGKLFSADMYNSSAGTVYMFICDATAVPSDGSFPTSTRFIIRAPTETTASATWTTGRQFTTGIVLAASSTDATFTAIATDDCLFDSTHAK